MARSLYICYFGVREPLVQTQVIPYLRELVKGGHEVSLLTFESAGKAGKGKSEKGEKGKSKKGEREVKEQLGQDGIAWYSLTYHKRFSVAATAWDVFQGVRFIRRFVARERPDILHGRVHIPTLMGALARKFSRHKPKLLFDIRGFFPEEYTDAGIWPENGWLYRSAKSVERWLLEVSDGFVVLTERARDILFPESRETGYDKRGRPIEVIPCCVDISRFSSADAESRAAIREKLAIGDRYVMAYVGAFGGWYLTEETADLFAELKRERPDAFAMVLTQSRPEVIEPLLRDRGYGDGDYLVTKVPPTDLPKYLSGADAAVSFIKNCYSKQASSPTKNAEYLACGLPVIANAGIGDTDTHINGTGIGSLVSGFSSEELAGALRQIDELGDVRDRCRQTAAELFDLERVGGERYRRLYARLLES